MWPERAIPSAVPKRLYRRGLGNITGRSYNVDGGIIPD
jgi:hypothetical protein